MRLRKPLASQKRSSRSAAYLRAVGRFWRWGSAAVFRRIANGAWHWLLSVHRHQQVARPDSLILAASCGKRFAIPDWGLNGSTSEVIWSILK